MSKSHVQVRALAGVCATCTSTIYTCKDEIDINRDMADLNVVVHVAVDVNVNLDVHMGHINMDMHVDLDVEMDTTMDMVIKF
jgi:hypothetical protein